MDNKKKAIIKYSLIALPIIVVIILGVLFVRHRLYGRYSGYEVKGTVNFNGNVDVYNDNNLLFLCSKNGATAYGSNGTPVRALAYGLANPTVESCNSMCAIADIGGKNVYVVPENDIPVSYETEFPILKLRVAENGTTAVLLDRGDFDLIRIYNAKGELSVEIGTKTMEEGFPVDIALSDDGKRLATFYISFDGDKIISKVTFYNTGSVGKEYIENIVGQRIFEDRQVYSISFLENNRLGIVLNDGFVIYSMPEIPVEISNVTFDSEIIDMRLSKKNVVVVTNESDYRVISFYDTSGKFVSKIRKIPEYKNLNVNDEEAIICGKDFVYIFRKNGTVKFYGEFEGTIENMYFAGKNRYFISEIGRMQAIALVD